MKSVCPFCAAETEIHIVEYEQGRWAVVCDTCGATGPMADHEDGALERWSSASQIDGQGFIQRVAKALGI